MRCRADVRHDGGMGLFSTDTTERDLGRRVFQLEREVAELRAVVARLSPGTGSPAVLDAPAPSGVYEPSARVIDFYYGGEVIQAIKAVREETGWGLKEAKNFVDGLGRR